MNLGIEEIIEVWFIPANQEAYSQRMVQNFSSVDAARMGASMTGIVYVISDDEGLNKIGFTSSLRRRFVGIQSDRGRPCKVEYTTPMRADAHRIERIAHDLIGGNDVRGREWFACSTADAIAVVEEAITIAEQAPRDFFRVKAWRQNLGLSLRVAAARLGQTAPVLMSWEAGRRVPSKTTRIIMQAITEGHVFEPYPL